MNKVLPFRLIHTKLFLVWASLLFAGNLYGQDNLNNFNHITTSNQFSLNSVTAISQDQQGFMWFGTRNGLVRYDGIKLKYIKRGLNSKPFLNSNDINDIYIDSRGDIWMATSEGLSVYNPEKDAVINFPVKGDPATSTSSNAITCVKEMSSGEFWIGTNKGLSIYNPGKKTFRHVLHNPALSTSLSSNNILCLYQSNNGTIWVGTDKGLNKLLNAQNGQLQFNAYQQQPDDAQSIVHDEVHVLQEDRKGNLWVGTFRGLDYLDVKRETFSHFSKANGNLFTSEFIRAMTVDWSGRLWVGTYDGINVIDMNHVVQHIRHNPDLPASLVDNKIRALFTDVSGSVWLGSYYGGINYWDERQLNFSKIDEGNGHKLSFKVVSAIVQDQDENIYFGTEGEGISIFNAKKNQYEYINKLAEGLKIGAVKTLMLDRRNELWIGTYNTGLLLLNPKTKAYKQYRNDPRNESSISSDKILSVLQSADGKYWVGTLASGLNLFDPATETFFRIRANQADEQTISSNVIRTLYQDRKGNLYVGTSQGLSMLPEAAATEGSAFTFTRLKAAVDPMLKLDIQDILEDKEGRIWVCTKDFGLFQVKGDQLVSEGLKGVTSVYAIVQNNASTFWLSSNEGVIKYNTAKKYLKIYDSREGVQSNEFIRASKLLSKSGRVYFGGASGVTSFRPEGLGGLNDYAPDVVITGFRLFDRSLEAGDSTGILQQSIEKTQRLTLDYHQNIFTINFAMPNFIETENNVYQYRLKGLDSKWTTTSTPVVTYTIQQGGDYVFEVKAENGDGYRTSGLTSLEIEVLSPPWRTWWAYTLYTLFVLGAFIYIVYEYQSRIKLQHKLDLETREFLHQQEVNKQKLQFFTNISHEFRTPLTLISGPLQKLMEDYKGPHKFFRQLLVIKKNTDQLYKLINELLDFRKLEDRQIRLQAAEGNIVKFLREIYLSFSEQAKAEKYTYTFETESEEVPVYFDRDKLEKVFYNLLANAFKHTPRKGTISMRLKCVGARFEISVNDNGDGMEADQTEKIFDRFYEIPAQKSYGQFKHGSGIGLAIVKSVIDLHKGDIRVESAEGMGSSFIVSLPAGRAHLMDEEVIKEFKDSEDISRYMQKPPVATESALEMPTEMPLETAAVAERKCVLVVEDNPEVGNFVRSVLADHYRVVLVENGLLGYKSAIQLQPDLIISDLMMPEMDGIEFCSKVKSDLRTSHIPFILLSARTSLLYKYDGLESGADDYLYKPFELKELLLKCKNIIQTHERLKEKFSSSGVFTSSEIAVNSLDETMMKKAFAIVNENIGNEFFGVEQFCEELGISRSLLFTKFKAWTNQTPNEFILNIRMRQAAQLIEKNSYNLSEIGYKVGFKDPSYFSKVFKKHFSLTPKAYAEKFWQDFHVV